MVEYGADLLQEYAHLFKGRRLGLITSVSGTTNKLESVIDVLHAQYGLSALFSPEHGVRGNLHAGQCVDTYTDSKTGVPLDSLYQKNSKRLTPEMLEHVDAVVYDIQDIGTRYYTFISTLLYAVEDCAKYGKELIVLDRPNPLGGKVEGNLLQRGFESFVGAYPICMRYGLTAGEFAAMANSQQGFGCQLSIVPVRGWKRSMLFSETGNHWMMPSLGIPRFDTALAYPGTCLFEGTNLSEGRGTTCPFEIIGAPFIDGARLCAEANALKLEGVVFTPAYFTPSFSKHEGVPCQGVHLHITSPHNFAPVETGMRLLYLIRAMYTEFSFLPRLREGGKLFISLLMGCDAFAQETVPSCNILLEACANDSLLFAKQAQAYHRYD